MLAERLVDPNTQPEDHPETSLRPKMLKDFVGQAQVRENLQVFIDAARKRGEAMDHVLFFGPPGLGKTTLSQIISSELGVGFRATSGPIISKAGDLAAILTNLQPRDVLFIDEIHRLNAHIEEVLYPAMEDFKLDLIIGEGPSARSIRIDLPPFTLVAATTRTGLMTSPLRDRFGIPLRLEYYTPAELEQIVARGAHLLKMSLSREGIQEIAKRSRGTPRIAGRLLRRVRDFASVEDLDIIGIDCVDSALQKLGVDRKGLDNLDRLYLERMATIYAGGPVGIDTMAALLSEQRDSLEEVVEPFLIQQGFVQKTPRGRILTQEAFDYMGIPSPLHSNQTEIDEV
ncbi:MAG: Holliday junction branch migration DNA helicase RuvB [Alphaproteobacteria bacterium]|nr:Holliday junction branch migration DNA helicase RuvB [Alphaproteobacteria bacterium]